MKQSIFVVEKIIQWIINLGFLALILTLWLYPTWEGFDLTGFDFSSSYEDEYYDEVTPDEVAALDAEIEDVLWELDQDFNELYDNRAVTEAVEVSYAGDSARVLSDTENFNQNAASVVYISAEGNDGYIYYGSGTALTSDGVILTNYHVLVDSAKVLITTTEGQHYPATQVLASDEFLDICIFKVAAEDLQPVTVGDPNALQVGDKTLVIGHPEGFLNTLSIGNVSGFRSYESQNAGLNIQITNAISGGNSGGAMLNDRGELVGIPAWSLEYDDNSVQVQNINFAVPVDAALALLE